MMIFIPLVFFGVLGAVKLISYGLWAKGHGNIRGMVGLFIYAFITLAFPMAVYFYRYTM